MFSFMFLISNYFIYSQINTCFPKNKKLGQNTKSKVKFLFQLDTIT